jgi:hypothetical protein
MAHDNDAVYIWRATGNKADQLCKAHAPAGHVLVKFGATSLRLKHQRIHEVARRHGLSADILHNNEVHCAKEAEGKLLRIGIAAYCLSGDGSTEFRFVSPEELLEARALAKMHSSKEFIAQTKQREANQRAEWARQAVLRAEHAEYVAEVRAGMRPLMQAAKVKIAEAQARLEEARDARAKDHKGVGWLHVILAILFGFGNIESGGKFLAGVALYLVLLLAGWILLQFLRKEPTAVEAASDAVHAAEAELSKLRKESDDAVNLPMPVKPAVVPAAVTPSPAPATEQTLGWTGLQWPPSTSNVTATATAEPNPPAKRPILHLPRKKEANAAEVKPNGEKGVSTQPQAAKLVSADPPEDSLEVQKRQTRGALVLLDMAFKAYEKHKSELK